MVKTPANPGGLPIEVFDGLRKQLADLKNAIHIGHSTGGGQATRYVARHGQPQS